MRACWRRRLAILVLLVPLPAAAWGPRTHRLVTDLAVDLMPGPCGPLLRAARAELLARALEPDTVLRQREGPREAVRHFIDLDAYLPYPFIGFPHRYRDAAARYGRRTVHQRGVLPWVILRLQRELRTAVHQDDRGAIVRIAGHLSHYIADAHQPLHLTVNHDGQRTGNDGVHLRLELGVVDDRIERYAAALRGRAPPARHLNNVSRELFASFEGTYSLIAVIMRADREATGSFWPYSPLYYRRLDAALHPMIEQQLAAAASLLASTWFTACAENGPTPPPIIGQW